jgi:hypothetical protein
MGGGASPAVHATMPGMSRSALAAVVVLVATVTGAFAQSAPAGRRAAAPAAFSPGRGTIWVGSYSGHLTAVDEATGTFTKVPLKTGPPFVVRLSPDRSRFYVQSANQERFEVVDAKTRQSIDTFTLSDARRHVRALAFEVDPTHRTMVIVARTATRLIDRWEIGAPEFLMYDLASHAVTRTVPWTIEPEAGYFGTALRFSPDGTLLYVLGQKVTVLDAASMQQVEEWDLALPADAMLGRFEPGAWDDAADPQGYATGLFTMNDAVQHRRLLVIGRIDLAARSVDTFVLGPEPKVDGVTFHVSPDRRLGHALLAEIGRHQLWTIDLGARAVVSRVDVPTRTRMQMRASSNGQALYLYEAGRTIEVWSADASTRLKTIELDSDMMYATFVIVPPASSPK